MKLLCLSLAFILFSVQTFSQTNFTLQFDGTDKYITVPHNTALNFTNAFTVEAWINTNSATTRQVIAAKMVGGFNTWLFELQPAGGGVKLNLFTQTSTSSDHLSNSLIPANQWCHVAATYDGAAVRFYVNGVADGSSAQSGNLSTNTMDLRIGAWGAPWGGGDERRFNGMIDEVRLWNVVRTASEIKKGMYGIIAPDAAGLVAYYKMNEGSLSATANSCTNTTGLDGTLVNAPSWQASPIQFAGNALNFDGSNDVVQVPYSSSLDMTGALTLEAWVYPAGGHWMNLIMKGSYGYGLSLSGSSGLDGCNFGDKLVYWDQAICGFTIRSSLSYTENAWHHAAVTVNDLGSQLEIYFYLDGVQDGPYYSNETSISNGGASSQLYLGMQGADCSCNYLTGDLDEVRIWNVVRSASEIQNNREKEIDPSTATGLVAYYTFDQNIAAGDNTGIRTLPDQKGNNNGTLTNFALSGATSNFIAQNNSLVVLPLQWLSFNAQKQNGSVKLDWSTANEQNTKDFIVQHSTNGIIWTDLATIIAVGDGSGTNNYSYLHTVPFNGTNFYRLLQRDNDGRYSYSKIVTVKFDFENLPLTVLSNPVKNILALRLNATMMVSLYNDNGMLLWKKEIHAGNSSINMQNLARGIYFLKAGTQVEKVLVQ